MHKIPHTLPPFSLSLRLVSQLQQQANTHTNTHAHALTTGWLAGGYRCLFITASPFKKHNALHNSEQSSTAAKNPRKRRLGERESAAANCSKTTSTPSPSPLSNAGNHCYNLLLPTVYCIQCTPVANQGFPRGRQPLGASFYYYRPQRSWAKVIFSQACVKNSVHRGGGVCLGACWDAPPGAGADPPPEQEQTPPEQEQTPPRSRNRPPGAEPPPGSRHPPEADSSIRSTSGRYASYWSAFS